jgi:hypothetical protein
MLKNIGQGQLDLNYGSVSRQITFEVADPQQAERVELSEVTDTVGTDEEVECKAVDWVDVAQPFSLQALTLEPLELNVGNAKRRLFVVQTKLADQSLVFGGTGRLTVGPHGVVDLVNAGFSPFCAAPFSCGLFEFQVHAEGQASLTMLQPTGDLTQLPIHVNPAGATL